MEKLNPNVAKPRHSYYMGWLRALGNFTIYEREFLLNRFKQHQKNIYSQRMENQGKPD